MQERLLFNGSVVSELRIPRKAKVLMPEFSGDVVTVRIQGKGYLGGHNTAEREGWPTWYPTAPEGTIAVWDDSEEGTWSGYDPAIMIVLPFVISEVATKFLADLKIHTAWYSASRHVTDFANRLEACINNGVQFAPEQQTEICSAQFSIIGPGAQEAFALWRQACSMLSKWKHGGGRDFQHIGCDGWMQLTRTQAVQAKTSEGFIGKCAKCGIPGHVKL